MNTEAVEVQLRNICVTLAKLETILETNTKQLAEHMRRTDLLEKRVAQSEIPIRVIGYLGVPLGIIFIIWEIFLKGA